MARVNFSLVEQSPDLRSNQVAYNFVVENQGPGTIYLTQLTPRIPEGVNQIEVRDPSQLPLKARYEALCDELTHLINNIVFNKMALKPQKKGLSRLLEDVRRIMISVADWPVKIDRSSDSALLEKAVAIKIENFADAESYYERYVDKLEDDNEHRKIFEAKKDQLSRLEPGSDKLEPGSDKSLYLAIIQPGSYFAVTYVLEFPRKSLNSRKYQVAVDASYVVQKSESDEDHPGGSEKSGELIGGATTSLLISPRAAAVTGVALVGSILGVALSLALAGPAPIDGVAFSNMLLNEIIGSTGVSAMILALLFFNVYEHTTLGSRFTMGIGWRSALLIGCLCGLASDKILAAHKGLIGA
jgi:hypothetical protein